VSLSGQLIRVDSTGGAAVAQRTVTCPDGFPNVVSGGYSNVDMPIFGGPTLNQVTASFPVGIGPVPRGAWTVTLQFAESWTAYAICSR
jgi:hypothetical protein